MDILKYTTEYIDNYLLNALPQEERTQFEAILSKDKSLQRKVALQAEVVRAIREQNMRQMLANIKEQKAERKNLPPIRQRVMRWTATVLSPIAIAACLFGLIVHLPQVNNLEHLNTTSPQFTLATQEITLAYSNLKGCEDVATTMLQATELMQAGDYKQADALLATELKQHKDVTKEQAQAWSEKEDMLYLQALCAMQQKQVYRSRALLTNVISMHGIHEEQATTLLHQIKYGK